MYVRLPGNIASLLMKYSNMTRTPRLVFTCAPGGYIAFFTRVRPWYESGKFSFFLMYFKDHEEQHVLGNDVEHFYINDLDNGMYDYLIKLYEKHLTSD